MAIKKIEEEHVKETGFQDIGVFLLTTSEGEEGEEHFAYKEQDTFNDLGDSLLSHAVDAVSSSVGNVYKMVAKTLPTTKEEGSFLKLGKNLSSTLLLPFAMVFILQMITNCPVNVKLITMILFVIHVIYMTFLEMRRVQYPKNDQPQLAPEDQHIHLYANNPTKADPKEEKQK